MPEPPADRPAPGDPDAAADAPGPPTAEEAASWSGRRLDEIAGAGVGKVEGVYVDADSGKLEWLLARMGRFGHHSLVPARDAVAAAGRVWVPYTREQIRRAPRVEPKTQLTRERELELLAHYGIGTVAGRAAEVESRAEDAVTARPL